MNQCPVCAAPRKSSGAGCPECGFALAFVTHFAGAESKRRWESELEKHIRRRRNAQQAHRTALSVLDGQIACIENGVLVRFGASGRMNPVENAAQISQSRTHALTLLSDGSVIAEGSNRMGQCNVQDIKNAAFVLAGPNISYIIDRDGRVLARGVSPMAGTVEGWRDIEQLACGDHFVAGRTKDGGVYVATDGYGPFGQALPWRNIRDIAAGSDYLIALDGDGNVHFAGYDDDPRARAAGWKNVTAIAAEDMYAAGLSEEGRVLLAGEGGWLDRGRSEAAQWTDVTAIAAGHGAIAAVDASGRLHIAGSSFLSTAARESVIAQWGRG